MMQPFGNKLYYIIVGTGRCGTVSISKLFNAVGIPCSHERIFNTDGPSRNRKDSEVSKKSGLNANMVMAEASYMAVPYLDHYDAKIIHLVRDPVAVIQSFHNKLQYWHHSPNRWEKFILSHLAEIATYPTPLDKNCCYVVRWNRWIEKHADLRIRIEKDIDILLDYLKIPFKPQLEKVNTFEEWEQRHEKLSHPVSKEDILNSAWGEEVKRLALCYGYD